MLRHVPDKLETQEMRDTEVRMDPGTIMILDGVLLRFPSVLLLLVPDHIKAKGMCEKAVEKNPCLLKDVPERLLTLEMCDNAVRMEPWSLRIIPDYFKSHEMCDETVAHHLYTLEHVADSFVTQQEIGPCDDDCHDELIKWYEDYQKRKA